MKQDARHWRDVPERLARRTGGRVICLDLPGVGEEVGRTAPLDVAALAADLRRRWLERRRDDGPWGLLGLSLGGMAALAWASRWPHDLDGVVVGNTSAGVLCPPTWRLRGSSWPVLAAA